MAKKKKTSADVANDIYDNVTARILAELEKGVRPWEKPWTASDAGAEFPIRAHGEAYQGINVLLLWLAQMEKSYTSNRWMGFNQARDLGGTVRKGEKGTQIVYWGALIPKDEAAAAAKGQRDPEKRLFLKASYVWNVNQIDDLPEQYLPKEPVPLTDADKHARIDTADVFFKKTGSKVIHGGGRAYYSGAEHEIHIPDFGAFRSPESYYATLGHEHIHWTGAKHLLNRDMKNRFGSNTYAAEELIAEIGSAFLCARLGIASEVREDHASYIAHWIKILKNDNKFIMQAASAAQKAVKVLANELDISKAQAEEAA